MASHEVTFDLNDAALCDRVSIRLRQLQMKLEKETHQIGRIVTVAGRARHAELREEHHALATIAWALEEGRLLIAEANEDTMAARMAADIEIHFGTTPEPGQEGSDGPAGD